MTPWNGPNHYINTPLKNKKQLFKDFRIKNSANNCSKNGNNHHTCNVAPTQNEQQVSTGLFGRPWKPVCCLKRHQRCRACICFVDNVLCSRPINTSDATAQNVLPPTRVHTISTLTYLLTVSTNDQYCVWYQCVGKLSEYCQLQQRHSISLTQ